MEKCKTTQFKTYMSLYSKYIKPISFEWNAIMNEVIIQHRIKLINKCITIIYVTIAWMFLQHIHLWGEKLCTSMCTLIFLHFWSDIWCINWDNLMHPFHSCFGKMSNIKLFTTILKVTIMLQTMYKQTQTSWVLIALLHIICSWLKKQHYIKMQIS